MTSDFVSTDNSSPTAHASSALTRASEAYSRQASIRMAINAIPYVGGALDVLFQEGAARAQQRRIDRFIDETKTAFAAVDQTKVDRDYLASEEFSDTALKAFEAAARTRDDDKLRMYARLLVGASSPQNSESVSIEALIDSMLELTTGEILLARRVLEVTEGHAYDVYEPPNDEEFRKAMMGRWQVIRDSLPRELTGHLTFHLKRLEQAGLITELSINVWGSSIFAAPGLVAPTSALVALATLLGEEQ